MTFLLPLLNSFFFSHIQNAYFTLKYEASNPCADYIYVCAIVETAS